MAPRAMLRPLIKIGMSAILLAFVLWLFDWRLVLAKMLSLPAAFILLAWIYYTGCQFISTLRWKLLLTAQNVSVPIARLFSLYMLGMFANSFLPGGVGGDALKVWCLYRDGNNGAVLTASVVLERFCGLMGVAVLGIPPALFLLLRGDAPVVAAGCLATSIGLTATAALVWWSKSVNWLRRLLARFAPASIAQRVIALVDVLYSYKNQPDAIIRAVLISVLLQASIAGYYSATGVALGAWISPFDFLLFMPVVTLVTLLPISFGGLGFRELVMAYLFRTIGINAQDVLATSLTAHALNLALSLVVGLAVLAPMLWRAEAEIVLFASTAVPRSTDRV